MPKDERMQETEVRCVVCRGGIVAKFQYQYVGHGSPIIGPGGKSQWQDVFKGYHCKDCGIKYEFLPLLKQKGQ